MWLFSKRDRASDEELALNYFNTGNKQFVGDLFEKHVKTVFGVCLFYFKDKEVAQDAVMQIFEKLMVELRKTKVNNFKGWLSFVVRNYCIGELRKNKGRYFVPETYLDFEMKEGTLSEEETIAGISDEALLDGLKEALPRLKDKQRQCIELFFLKGHSYEEICKMTGHALGEVKSYIQNGKRNLKIMLEEKTKNKNNAA